MRQAEAPIVVKERPGAAKGTSKKSSKSEARASIEVTVKDGGKRKKLGKRGEEIACMYLTDNGADIVERNWSCHAGEADIIAWEGEDLAFIEVKTRSSYNAGFPEDAVTRQKRIKYEKIALQYLAARSLPSSRVRFDVIAVVMTGEMQALVRHHRDAYCAGE